MRLIVISNPEPLKGEHETIIQMMESGLMHFHLRKPAFSKEEMAVYLRGIPAGFHQRIVVHSHHSLINDFNLGGIHFTGKTINQIDNICLPYSKTKSASCHSFAEINNYGNKADYLFLSPVYNSISKQGYNSGFSKEELINFFRNYNGKADIVALGGVYPEKTPELKALGFNGCAVLGFIWKALLNKNIKAALNNYIKLKEHLLKLETIS